MTVVERFDDTDEGEGEDEDVNEYLRPHPHLRLLSRESQEEKWF